MKKIFIKSISIMALAGLLFATGCGDDDEEIGFTAEATIEVDKTIVTEGSALTFTVSLSAANTSGEAITFSYSTSGTSTSGSDYSAPSGTVTIAENASSATVLVSTIDDESLEDNETLIITLSNPNIDGLSITTNSAQATIEDNDTRTVTISSTDTEATEESGNGASFVIALNKALDDNVVIPYTIDGSATNGSDYAELSGTVTITAGQTSVTVDVIVTDDAVVESTETITISLESTAMPSGVSVGAAASVTLNITDNDDMGSFEAAVSITASDDTALEGNNDGSFTISFDKVNDSGSTISVSFTISGTATSGSDYRLITKSVEIPNGSQTAEVSVIVIDDTKQETDETVVIDLDGSNLPDGITLGSPTSATVTIQDDNDLETTVSIAATDDSATEGADGAEFTISLGATNNTGSAITIPYTLLSSGSADVGSDFSSLSGSVDIANGASSATVTINVIDDADIEADETIILSIDEANLPTGITIGSPSQATVTITDNDVATTSYFAILRGSPTVGEGDGSTQVRIVLNETNATGSDMTFTYTVSGTATSGDDYKALSGTATIANGAKFVIIDIPITDDGDEEDDETIIITLSDASLPADVTLGSPSEKTITIEDNDGLLAIDFLSSSENSITVSTWTTVSGIDGYVIKINNTDSFSDLDPTGNLSSSTTYRGNGEQIVYSGASIEQFEVTLLEGSYSYYFKIYTYSGVTADNGQVSQAQSTSGCAVSSETENEVCWDIDVAGDIRTVDSNSIPNHATGNFPNANVTAIAYNQSVDLTPSSAGMATYVYSNNGGPYPSNPDDYYKFGFATNGIGFNPMGLKPWENEFTGEQNWAWQAAVINEGDTDLDEYGAHVTSQGSYHYHGDVVGLAPDEDGSRHSLIYGYAADGFPIYYKYGYSDPNDPTSAIVELLSAYKLKTGARTDDGVAGEDYPDGNYDGTYIQDYEHDSSLPAGSDIYLDECNGRTGVTPEYPEGTYYYVITSDFPKVPNCFMGTPNDGFKIGN